MLIKWSFLNKTSKLPGPLRIPLIGNLWRYKFGIVKETKYHEYLTKLFQRYGPVVKQNIGNEPIVHVFNPDDVKNIYSKENKTPEIKPLQETIQFFRKQNNASLGLGNSNGDIWYKYRNSLKPLMLTPIGIEKFINGTEKATNDLIQKMKTTRNKDGTINSFMNVLGAWSMEAAGRMCFGKSLGYLNENENEVVKILRANRTIFYISTHLKFSTILYKYMNLPKWKCLQKSEVYTVKETTRLTDETIDSIKKSTVESEEKANSVVKHLMSIKDLNHNDIQVLIQSLFTDSLSTTIPTLVFSLYILATDSTIQQKAYEEAKNFIEKDSALSNKKLDNLYYIKGLIKETLRLYPSGTEISRVLMQDHTLSGYTIPANTHVNLNMNVLLRSPNEYPNPLKVLPERWIRKENIHQKAHPFILIPFGHGSRTCMGRRFAEQNLQIALAKILYNFKLGYKKTVKPIEQLYNILLYPSDTRGLIFELR